MSSDTGELFNETVKGRVPLSTNNGAASNWLPHGEETGAYVPRPDVSLTTMRFLSLLPFGFEHMYARSPLTGLLKCVTLGGGGLWWLWDICQLFGESDRVLKYGMSAPLDIVTGIAQGMITDKASAYRTNTPYAPWFISILFSFMGLDALLSKQTGQFMRKFMEFLILVGCCIGIWRVVMGGIDTGAIVGLFFLSLFGMLMFTIVGDEYINVMSIVFSGELFTTGLSFTKKAHSQYNATLGIIDSLASIMFPPVIKEQIVKDLQYGGVSPKELLKMFNILHSTEYATQQQKETSAPSEGVSKKASSVLSFLILLISPFLLLASWLWYGLGLIYPPARYMEIAAGLGIPLGGFDMSSLKKGVKAGDIKGKAGVTAYLQKFVPTETGEKVPISGPPTKMGIGYAASRVADALGSKFSGLGQGATRTLNETISKSMGAVSGVGQSNDTTGKLGLTAGIASKFLSAGQKQQLGAQVGGAVKEEPLSTEAQVFGAVTVALIGGGVIKSLVDYLVKE